MKYVNIELGKREVRVNLASLEGGRLNARCCARSRLDAVYVNGSFCIDVDAIVACAIEGLREAGQVDAVTLTGVSGSLVILDGNGQMLKVGMCIAIEPMIVAGQRNIRMLPDKWTVCTADHQMAAHYEHTIALTKRGADILSTFKYVEEVLGAQAI